MSHVDTFAALRLAGILGGPADGGGPRAHRGRRARSAAPSVERTAGDAGSLPELPDASGQRLEVLRPPPGEECGASEGGVRATTLRRVTIERQDRGGWKLLRERDETGETFHCDDLHDAFDCVLDAYRPDGTPRGAPRQGTEEKT